MENFQIKNSDISIFLLKTWIVGMRSNGLDEQNKKNNVYPCKLKF